MGQASALHRPDRQPVAHVVQKPKAEISLILDGLAPVFSACRDCGGLMQVCNSRDHSHPLCDPKLTASEVWEQQWLAIASSSSYERMQPHLRNRLERLEFKIEIVRDEPAALHNAAMQYAEWGWPVFPLKQNDKRPFIRSAHGKNDPLQGKCRGECGKPGHGVLDATSDVERICRWWSRNPEHNIGLATGFLFDAIDVDPDKGGAESITKLLAANRIPVVHGIVATAGADKTDKELARPAGMHLYIKATGRGNSVNVLPGVDYQGKGGYVVAPPSTLGNRVRSWSWAVEPSPEIREENK